MGLDLFPGSLNFVQVDSGILEGYSSDTIYRAEPDAVARPHTTAQVQALLRHCHANHIGVTPCGSQTSVTGSSVTHGQLLLSSEKLSTSFRVYEDPQKAGRWLVDAGPAVILADLQDRLAEMGYFYPPDPTSRGDVMLAATIATNASGEDTYKYGATRRWVRGLTYVRADGSLHRVTRAPEEQGDGRKNTSGYPIRQSEIDLLIGSEGTLGIIVEATLEVLPRVPKFFAVLFFLPCETAALREALRLKENPLLDPRCVEYMDQGALAILREKDVQIPETATAALYIKREYRDEADQEQAMTLWFDHLEALYQRWNHPELLDHVHCAEDDASQRQLRRWRHHIPATINERAARFRPAGGGKISTDWYVPLDRLETMFAAVRKDQGQMEWVTFGHMGNGHPHFNFVTKNEREYARGRQLLLDHCRLAVAMGGGVSGEHGLGKLKSHLLKIQYSNDEIARMIAVKKRMDPRNILGRGNIFESLEL